MPKSDQLDVELHFVPLSSDEADERKQHLRALLVRGALRFAQKHADGDQQAGKLNAAGALHLDLVHK
jgi:hypothetical protein